MKKTSYLELSTIVITILTTFNSKINLYIIKNNTGIDSWLTIILSYIIGIVPLFIIIYISNYQKELNLFEKNIYLFGKVFGTMINLVISIILFLETL